MAKYRMIYTSIWDDEDFERYDPSEKLFWVFLLSNPKTSQCGIYRLTIKSIIYYTGFSIEVCEELIQRFVDKGKIYYDHETKEVAICNWPRFNLRGRVSNTIMTCIQEELDAVKSYECVRSVVEANLRNRYIKTYVDLGRKLSQINQPKSDDEDTTPTRQGHDEGTTRGRRRDDERTTKGRREDDDLCNELKDSDLRIPSGEKEKENKKEKEKENQKGDDDAPVYSLKEVQLMIAEAIVSQRKEGREKEKSCAKKEKPNWDELEEKARQVSGEIPSENYPGYPPAEFSEDAPDWTEVARKMADYLNGEGKSSWQLQCEAAKVPLGAIDPLTITTVWAGKNQGNTIALCNWQIHTGKLTTWIRNQYQSEQRKTTNNGQGTDKRKPAALQRIDSDKFAEQQAEWERQQRAKRASV